MREGLKFLLESRGDFQVVGESDRVEKALEDPRLAQSDLVLLDLNLPGKDGLFMLDALKNRYPALRSVVFTMHKEESKVLAALESGAAGYVLKTSDSWELLYALKTVSEGGSFLHPSVAPSVIKSLRSPKTKQDSNDLSERELEILSRLASGRSTKGVCEELFLSPNTIKTHLRRIYRKLGVQDKTQAVLRCVELGVLPPLRGD